ncbi:MAG: ATP-binding cassette domain-containing protein, partial [Altibacter sp.]|nr:ATP-binding cassette domain-containing protein [Altibacter sp.]
KGSVTQIFKSPQNSYTKALLASRPTLNKRLAKLPTIASLANKTFVPSEITPQQRAMRHKELYTKEPLLEIHNLEKVYYSNTGLFQKKRIVKAVDGVSFKVFEGETLGLVGESGCGKSTLGKAILQLDKATAGKILYRGKSLLELSNTDIRRLRKELQLIFQDPYSSLNPRILIGEALIEPMKVHRIGRDKRDRKKRALNLLERVGLDESYYYRYAHELSGGQRQRVGIARTIAMEPKLVICDESVSALDISVQAQVLNLLNELKDDFGFTYIFISHDLAVVKYMADQLVVMKEGAIVEVGDADEIYANPTHAYTKRLIEAIPKGI